MVVAGRGAAGDAGLSVREGRRAGLRTARSVADLASDLQAWLEQRSGSAWRDPLPRRFAKLVRRNPVRATVVAAGLLVVTAGLVAFGQARIARAEGLLRRIETEGREAAERSERDRAFLARLFELRGANAEWTRGSAVQPRDDRRLLRAFRALWRPVAARRRGGSRHDLREIGSRTRRPARARRRCLDLALQMERSGVAHAVNSAGGLPLAWATTAPGRVAEAPRGAAGAGETWSRVSRSSTRARRSLAPRGLEGVARGWRGRTGARSVPRGESCTR